MADRIMLIALARALPSCGLASGGTQIEWNERGVGSFERAAEVRQRLGVGQKIRQPGN